MNSVKEAPSILLKVIFVISCEQGFPSLINQVGAGCRQFCPDLLLNLSLFNALHLVNVSPSTDLYGKCGSEDGNLPSENTSSSTEPMEERYVLDFASNSDDLKNDEDKTRLHQLQEPAQKHIPGSVLFVEQ